MLYLFFAKTKLQHRGETFGEYPYFYYFNRTLLIFNEIYNEIIGICKIASNFYQYDELKKDQFTFSKVVANMNATRKIGEQGEEIIE